MIAPIPPIAKLKIKLSISKPVLLARLNKDGGLQYSGTNKCSVSPKGAVKILTQNISLRSFGLTNQISSQTDRSTKDAVNHGFNAIVSLLQLSSRQHSSCISDPVPYYLPQDHFNGCFGSLHLPLFF